ncbi:MAG: PEP-CTERM sorting domain-containing protein [Leptolyngbya sp. UWPOB_LEPTO1]|uniref:PEP-CTERM sorting domain-containing protein n=1 Tax=Leptolyngbya sp. UWPOB_LEPTO1 TaxID=2815653 RepID=UPI001ACB50B6|nr:PEP-CTERM sorting domain-containing protein [Leptolyngbya sp. UWPOB_LEPTO1]MBN8561786.1 PEP-CTERM sorting domain-containing protein [Leptolyngbya sp. UWPOB_LEPTO1]
MKKINKSSMFAIACTAFMGAFGNSHATAATLNLANSGLQNGTLNGAFFQEIDPNDPAGTGVLNSFVRLQSPGNSTVEEGYNTDGSLQFNEMSGNFTRSLKLSDVPIFTIGGVKYRQFVLDINEKNAKDEPLIDLEKLQIFLGNAGNLVNYPTFGGNAVKIFDLDGNEDNTVKLRDTNAGSGRADLLTYIPDSLFSGPNQYVYLYSKFSGAEGGFEEWAVQVKEKPDTPPKSVPEPAALAGLGLVAGAMTFARRRKSSQTA